MTMTRSDRTLWTRRRVLGVGAAAVIVAACGSDDDSAASGAGSDPGVQVVSPERAAEIIDESGDELFVLDVRTPEEFEEGHLEGAELIDIQAPGFEDAIDGLDRDRTYVLYCRSGNRSARARTLMDELDFRAVYDVDGGIVAWTDAGLPVVT